MIRLMAVLCIGLLAWSGNAHAQSVQIGAVTTYAGDCRRYDVNEKIGVIPASCKSEVAKLTFRDGFTSLQFTSFNAAGKEIEKVGFVGPRWNGIDETHSSMVISQMVLAKPPTYQAKDTPLSGFCLFYLKSKDDPHDHPARIVCEYDSSDTTHIFVLADITKIEPRQVQ